MPPVIAKWVHRGEATLSNVGGHVPMENFRRTQEQSWGPTCWSGWVKRPRTKGQGAEN